MQFTMQGRRALITGGSLGIGLAIGETFARAGASVTVVARRQDVLESARQKIAAAGAPKAVAVSADVGTAEGCERAFHEAVAGMGGVDVLVNNAGTSQRGPFEKVSDELWQHDLDLKLFAAIRLCRLALPAMKAQRFGRIINVLNTGAKAPPAEGAPTAVTRAAGMALTKVLAGEGAKHNVLVNGLLVGRIESDQWVRRHAADGSNKSMDEYYADMGKSLPMGRLGTSQEFANAALFLASDAGSYITGTAINVDGGLCPVV
ncbi:MAG: SDR family oxidoreductase [Hyphomicrobiaceae bacterium]|nr:SDR family oxidoreductase [Hyphomicrobiaceae bacterium]